MAAANLRAWMNGESERLVWIEFDDYAHGVFASATHDWLSVANTFVSGVSQAQGVVATQVLSIDILAPYLAALERDGENPAEAVQAMLQRDEPRRFIEEVIDALAHRFAERLDLVLKLPSPAALLRQAGMTQEPSFDDLDDVGIGLSNLLREFSTKLVAGILVTCPEPLSGDESEALESVVSAARHYEWRVALGLDGVNAIPDELPEVDADLVLLPAAAIADVAGAADATPAIGGGLGAEYWRPGAETPATGVRVLLYGVIPADTQPELVVERVAAALG